MSKYSELSYQDLQKVAEEKGLPYHKISKEDLIASLEKTEVESDSTDTPVVPTEPVEPSTDEENAPVEDEVVEEAPVKQNKANTAFVYNAAHHLVRTYDSEIHGKKFITLAHQLAEGNEGFTVEEKYVAPAQICKSCGARMDE